MAKSIKYKLKDPRTCRVFFSSPFGGMEEERDELMRKYFPQIQHLCNSRGVHVEFVPVDMRWGITEEAADNAQTVTICLREVDRCDMFVGFYGQRYGWHGTEDKLLQRNIDVAASHYRWLKDKRDISVTEIEFLHGHLNKPGHIPACFCFRDKGYDDNMAARLEAEGDKKQAEKFRCESSHARQKLESLRRRVDAASSKTLAVHRDYFTPEEGANHMFNVIWEHLHSLLTVDEGGEDAKEDVWEAERLAEMADHDRFLVSRQKLYVGGDKYFPHLDKVLQSGSTGHVLVTGAAGQGKSALLANWVQHLQKKKQPKLSVLYHFIGSSQFSDKPGDILMRFIDETRRAVGDRVKSMARTSDTREDIRQMMSQLHTVLQQAEKTRQTVVMVIDGLDKLEKGNKTAKTLFWLPSKLPKSVRLVLSTVDTDKSVIEELVTVRHYRQVTLSDLDIKHKRQISEKALGRWGKTLSKQQLEKIVNNPQTSSPRYLTILLAELAMFGSFRQLDDKINSLLQATSIGELCEQMLERLEVDCNTPEHSSIVHKVLPLLLLAREGLSESEVTDILDIPVCVWLPVFFALEEYIVTCSGRLRFAFSEMCVAVEKRYLTSETDRMKSIKCLVKFFDEKRKNLPVWPQPAYSLCRRPAYELPGLHNALGNNTGLTDTLADLNIFHTLMLDNSYGVLEQWQTTGLSFQHITDLYLHSYDKAAAKLTQAGTDHQEPPAMKLLYHLESVYQLLQLASYSEGVRNVCNRIIKTLESMKGKCIEKRRERMLNEYKYHLACCLSDVSEYTEAEALHTQVIQYWRDAVSSGQADRKLGETRLAWSLNGIGLLQYHQKHFTDAAKLLSESEAYHKKHGNMKHEADCLVNLGLVHLASNTPKLAIDNFLAAIKLYEDVHFDSVPHIIGNVYTNLGLAYRHINNLELAEKHYLRSLEIKTKAVGWEHPSIATAYMNLGTVEMCRKHWTQMEEYTLKALNIFKVTGQQERDVEFRQCQENLLLCYLQQGKYQLAKSCYWSLFDALIRLGAMDECLPWVHNTMAKHYLDTGDYNRADRILTGLVNSSKRTAATFLYLDQLDQQRPTTTPRPHDHTLDHGLKLFPKSLQLLKQKVTHYIACGDVDGMMDFWSSVSTGPGDYATLVDWCNEAGKKHIAADILQRALKIFPNLE